MKGFQKYKIGYYTPPVVTHDWVNKREIEKAPIWCSVDLRDGNQALVTPMNLEEKTAFFQMLLKIGFKEIEVGFPAASETEFQFVRTLIEKKMIPDDVTIQVLTQAREHIIKRTFEAIEGAPHVIVHLYNPISAEQREQVFKKTKEEVKKIATDGAELLKKLAEGRDNIQFEYSTESFHGAEMEYALEVCDAVVDIWHPTADKKVIINLPSTVENAMPHVFADNIEYMSRNLKNRENVVLSLHPHNDRGCGVATGELGILAGADRIEGTLFGNGERTGNMDMVTMAMNLYSHGTDPGLDFSDMKNIAGVYERLTGMKVSERQPYAGELVFTAFSGSHQDAIAKGMEYRKQNGGGRWSVPYLPIDPADVGRTYDSDVIRINSQSGKGGVCYVLRNHFGMTVPVKMREDVGRLMKNISDHRHTELDAEQMYAVFRQNYMEPEKRFDIAEFHFRQEDNIHATVVFERDGKRESQSGSGNGRLSAVDDAIKKYMKIAYKLAEYEEHTLDDHSGASAMSYIGIQKAGSGNDCLIWGAGTATDIISSSVAALVNAVNRMLAGADE